MLKEEGFCINNTALTNQFEHKTNTSQRLYWQTFSIGEPLNQARTIWPYFCGQTLDLICEGFCFYLLLSRQMGFFSRTIKVSYS